VNIISNYNIQIGNIETLPGNTFSTPLVLNMIKRNDGEYQLAMNFITKNEPTVYEKRTIYRLKLKDGYYIINDYENKVTDTIHMGNKIIYMDNGLKKHKIEVIIDKCMCEMI